MHKWFVAKVELDPSALPVQTSLRFLPATRYISSYPYIAHIVTDTSYCCLATATRFIYLVPLLPGTHSQPLRNLKFSPSRNSEYSRHRSMNMLTSSYSQTYSRTTTFRPRPCLRQRVSSLPHLTSSPPPFS